MTQTDKERYQHAMSLYYYASREDSLREALAAFEEVRDYPGAKGFIEKCNKLLSWNVGATVEFGTWNGHPMQWEVLEVNGKERLLFAKELVGPAPYASTRRNTYWEDSELRRWLNGDFAREHFSLAEQTTIITTRLKNEMNPICYTQNGGNTVDKFYVFSHQEIKAWDFSGEHLSMGIMYWVRNPGHTLLATECICDDGTIYHLGANNESAGIMVRPVVRIRLN